VGQAIVDGRDRDRGGADHRPRITGGRGAAGQLRRDDRPRGIRVATRELEATQARAGAGLDERADPSARVVEDDGEVRHVAAEPPQVTRGAHDPVGGDDADRDGVEHGCRDARRAVAGGVSVVGDLSGVGDAVRVALEVDHVVAEGGQVGCESRAELTRRVDRDRAA